MKRFTQNITSYQGAVKHMLRFYAQFPNISYDQMSPASRSAWSACDVAMNEFTDSERTTILDFFSIKYTDQKIQTQMLTDDYDLSCLISRAIRAVAIKRGLVDKESEPNAADE